MPIVDDGPGSELIDIAVEARLLSSFVPAMMLKAIQNDGRAVQPPMTHQYDGAVALFAV